MKTLFFDSFRKGVQAWAWTSNPRIGLLDFGKLLILANLLWLTSACTLLQTATVPESVWRPQRAKLEAITTWQINASFVARSAVESFNGRLYWRQQDEHYTLRFNGPLGQGAVLIRGGPQEVVLRTGDNQTRRARDPETLFAEISAVKIPISHLRYWIRGLPAPGAASEGFAAHGGLAWLEQAGWRVTYRSHREQAGVYLPQRLTLESGEYYLNLSISRFSVPAS